MLCFARNICPPWRSLGLGRISLNFFSWKFGKNFLNFSSEIFSNVLRGNLPNEGDRLGRYISIKIWGSEGANLWAIFFLSYIGKLPQSQDEIESNPWVVNQLCIAWDIVSCILDKDTSDQLKLTPSLGGRILSQQRKRNTDYCMSQESFGRKKWSLSVGKEIQKLSSQDC